MTHQTAIGNPFMLLLNPEIVLAAVENSERLSQLNRHLCRPLDRPALANAKPGEEIGGDDEDSLDSSDGATEGATTERQ